MERSDVQSKEHIRLWHLRVRVTTPCFPRLHPGILPRCCSASSVPLCMLNSVCRPFKVSDRPLAYVWKNFISKDEAKHIATLAAPHLKQSLVGDNQKANTVRFCHHCPGALARSSRARSVHTSDATATKKHQHFARQAAPPPDQVPHRRFTWSSRCSSCSVRHAV